MVRFRLEPAPQGITIESPLGNVEDCDDIWDYDVCTGSETIPRKLECAGRIANRWRRRISSPGRSATV
jgi:hypothetical protein